MILACFFGLFDRLTEHQIVFVCVIGACCTVYATSEFTRRGGVSIGEKIGRWIGLAIFWSVAWLAVGLYFNGQRIDAEIQDVGEHISTSYITPSDRVVGNLRFTVTNHSAESINIATITCGIRIMQYIGLPKPSLVDDSVNSPGARLQPLGDSYSVSCPSNSNQGIKLPTTWLVCGEVIFTVVYYIDDAPQKIQRPRYRYILYENEHDWSPTALNENVQGCEGSAQ